MKRSGLFMLVLVILFLASVVFSFRGYDLTLKASSSEDKILWVDDDYLYPKEADGSIEKPFTSIQSAIDVADDGYTIKVLPGVYEEDLVIDKSLTIKTDDVVNTTITSKSKKRYMIDITADAVSIGSFTIDDKANTSHRRAVIHISPTAENVIVYGNFINHSWNGYGLYLEGGNNYQAAVINNNVFNNTRGIYIKDSFSNTLFGNTVANRTGEYGIILSNCRGVYIENNTFFSLLYGVYTLDSSNNYISNNTINSTANGIVLFSGRNNFVLNNTITNVSIVGIKVASDSCVITNNFLMSNSISFIIEGDNSVIYNNTVSLPETYAIFATSSSRNNIIYNNSFYGKPSNSLGHEDGKNYWNDSKYNGNYWADYYGPDNDEDLIGDIPYTRGGVRDNYPKGIFQKPPEIKNPKPEHLSSGVSRTPILEVTIEDPEDKPVNVYFYYIVENESRLINKNPITVESGSNASVSIDPTYSYIGLGYDYICLWYVVAEDEYSSNSSRDYLGTEWIFSTVNTPIDNKPPVADIGFDYKEVGVGDIVYFNGSHCNDTDGTIEFYRWSFGDGSSAINVRSPTHTYLNTGEYTVSLVVIDNEGSSDIALSKVNVTYKGPQKPKAVITAPSNIVAGKPSSFDALGSTDDDGYIKFYNWSFGDGSTGSGETVSHTYTSPGTYIVTLTVTDNSGLSSSASLSVTVKKGKGDTPGFEVLFLIIVLLGFVVYRKLKIKHF